MWVIIPHIIDVYVQEVCAELKIPTHGVNASKKEPVVEYSINKSLSPYANNRQGIFIKCTPVDAKMAKVLLDSGYKHLSDFQKWCPVKVTNICIGSRKTDQISMIVLTGRAFSSEKYINLI